MRIELPQNILAFSINRKIKSLTLIKCKRSMLTWLRRWRNVHNILKQDQWPDAASHLAKLAAKQATLSTKTGSKTSTKSMVKVTDISSLRSQRR